MPDQYPTRLMREVIWRLRTQKPCRSDLAADAGVHARVEVTSCAGAGFSARHRGHSPLLLKQTVSNFKRQLTRRVVINFGLSYETKPEQLEAIPGIVKGILEAQEQLRFDRAHFKGFGESALNFEVVYVVLVPDFNLHMDLQQMFNLQLMRELQNIGVSFAHPTRTIHVAGQVGPAMAPAEGS